VAATSDDRAGLLAQARARWAARDPQAVVALLEPLPLAELLGEPELGFLLATALRRAGEGARSLELVLAVAPACDRRGRDALWRRRLNLEAALQLERGATADAEVAWETLIDAAVAGGDSEMLAHGSNNLGVVCTLQARWEEALSHFGRALAACYRAGDRRGLAQAHQNVAISYRELDFWREADAHFESALETALADGSEDIAGRAEEERGFLFLLRGDHRLAAATATRALERFGRTGDRAGIGEATRVLGLVALEDGRLPDARALLQRALAAARGGGGPLLEAESELALGVLEAAAGSEQAAAAHQASAERLFTTIGATSWGERMRTRLTDVAARLSA
jgi:tetratricopeptide (TPR) repeat protein